MAMPLPAPVRRLFDQCEIGLRRLSSIIYLNRTGDKAGALHMLAVRHVLLGGRPQKLFSDSPHGCSFADAVAVSVMLMFFQQ